MTYTHVAGKGPGRSPARPGRALRRIRRLPHYPFPGGKLFRVPFTAIGAWYYSLRDKLGV